VGPGAPLRELRGKPAAILLLCFGSSVLCVLDRINISLAAPMMIRDLGWDEARMGVVFSAFFLGYVLFMVPGGLLADRFGARRVLASGVGVWSLFTVATPLFPTPGAVGACRFLVGAGQSLNFPCVSNFIAGNVPVQHRAKAQGFVLSGISAGAVIGFPLGSWIAQGWGWPAVFFVFGLSGALWIALWLHHTAPVRVAREPAREGTADPPPSWRVFLSHPSSLGLIASYFCHNYAGYFLLTWLPTYLVKVHGFSVMGMGVAAALPAAAALVCMNGSGWLSDHLTRRGMSRELSLKVMLYTGMAASGVFLSALLWVATPGAALAAIVLSAAARSVATPAYWTLSIQMAPRRAGLLSSLMNTSGNLAGIAAPALSGVLVARAGGWGWAIGIAALVSVAGAGVAASTVRGTEVA